MRFDAAGAEEPVDFAALGRGYTGYLHVMARFPAMTPAQRDQVCQAWLGALRRRDDSGEPPMAGTGPGPAGVRIYRTVRTLGPDHRPVLTARRLAHECR